MQGKIIGIDVGTKYIGIAVSDPEERLAFPVEVVPARPAKIIEAKIAEMIEVGGVIEIVIGHPLSLSGNSLPMTLVSEHFKDRVAKLFGLKTVLVDERLSTKMAEKPNKKKGVSKKGLADRPDARAAAIFLQNYLDSSARSRSRKS